MNYRRTLKALILLFLFASMIDCEQSGNEINTYKKPPIYTDSKIIVENGDTLIPTKLELFKDLLFVSYYKRHKIDIFNKMFDKIGSIPLVNPEPIFPTSFAITESLVIVSDHAKKVIVVYNRDGTFRESFGFLPDGSTALSPFDLILYGGVLYLSDIGMGKILAISMTNAENITEMGELILEIPSDSTITIGFPACVGVTFDGRLFVGDAQDALIKVFTCDGQYIYNFDKVYAKKPFSPMGFAFDDIIDPSLQDTSSFDPSGIRQMGRIHVVDANNATVHMFNPLGKYAGSYGDNGVFVRPSDIAIDKNRRLIFITDPQAKRIIIYGYGE